MNTIDPLSPAEPGTDPPPTSTDGIEIRMLHEAHEMQGVVDVFQQVWGSSDAKVPIEMLIAIAHAGGYVAGAFDVTGGSERMLGASVGLLARHQGRPALHSHMTGLLPGVRSSGLGRAIKLQQQAFAASHDIEWIVWTFDPLVRRNAWFNIAVLGAEVHEYLLDFYGPMTDPMNAGDTSDRLLVGWHVDTDPDTTVRDGAGVADPILVPTPDDILAIRRTDQAEAARWRATTRDHFVEHLEAGRRVVGFTRDGSYVFEG